MIHTASQAHIKCQAADDTMLTFEDICRKPKKKSISRSEIAFFSLVKLSLRERGEEGGERIKLSFKDQTEFRADAGETTMFHLALGAQK